MCGSNLPLSMNLISRSSGFLMSKVYDLLNNSFLAVGKKYGVSDNAVRKWCKSYNIPSKASEYKKLNESVR